MSTMHEPLLFGIDNVRKAKDAIDIWYPTMVEYKAEITRRVAEILNVSPEFLVVAKEKHINPEVGPILERVALWIHMICRQHIGQIQGNPFSGKIAEPIDINQIPYQYRVASNDSRKALQPELLAA